MKVISELNIAQKDLVEKIFFYSKHSLYLGKNAVSCSYNVNSKNEENIIVTTQDNGLKYEELPFENQKIKNLLNNLKDSLETSFAKFKTAEGNFILESAIDFYAKNSNTIELQFEANSTYFLITNYFVYDYQFKKIFCRNKILLLQPTQKYYILNDFLKDGLPVIKFIYKNLNIENSIYNFKKTYLSNFSISKGRITANNKNFIIKKGKVLDLGCGNFFYEKDFDTTVIGVDFSSNLDKPNFIQGNISHSELWSNFDKDEFDMITSFSVLHWIKNFDFIFKQMIKKLKHDGEMFHLMLTKHNFVEAMLPYIFHDDKGLHIKSNNINKNKKENLLNKNIDKDYVRYYCLVNNLQILNLSTYYDTITDTHLRTCNIEFLILHAKKTNRF